MLSKVVGFLNSKGFVIFSFAFMAVILFTQADHFYGYTGKTKEGRSNIISDGSGYYIYLPQYIVYSDSAHFSFTKSVNVKYQNPSIFSMLDYDVETKKLRSKFYVGTAVLQAPFYFVAHKFHEWNGWIADGYEKGYRFSIQIAAIFYWLIGAISLFKFFDRKGFSKISILVGIVLITFGTNLNQYASFWVTMSHVYSFSMVACFINVSSLWADRNKSKHFHWMLLLLGLIAIVRPINVLVAILVPFFFGSFTEFWERIKELFTKKYFQVIIGISFFILPVVIQLAIQFNQTGSVSLYTYKEEGFSNAAHPQFWNVLFSYQKGFFVYAPAMFVLFIGMYYFFRNESRFFALGWFATVLIWLYAISSWWTWDYGGGLGMRALIEMLPLFLIPIMYIFRIKNRIILGFSGLIIVLGTFYYQRLQSQFNSGIIDCCIITKADYWNMFLKTDERFRWMGDYDRMREHLDKKARTPEVVAEFRLDGWKIERNFKEAVIEAFVYENMPILKYKAQKTLNSLQGKLVGEIKLGDSKCNPFVSVRYFNNNELVEQSIFTIGSKIEDPFEFERFSIDINHSLANKNVNCAEFSISLGGCIPEFKNVKFIKYE